MVEEHDFSPRLWLPLLDQILATLHEIKQRVEADNLTDVAGLRSMMDAAVEAISAQTVYRRPEKRECDTSASPLAVIMDTGQAIHELARIKQLYHKLGHRPTSLESINRLAHGALVGAAIVLDRFLNGPPFRER